MRRGSVNNQTIGYSTRASNAIGQHKMKRMMHKKKAAMATSFVAAAKSNPEHDRTSATLNSMLRNNAGKCFLNGILLEPQARGDGRGYFCVEAHVRIVDFRMEDAPQCMNHGQGATFRKREADGNRYNGIGGHLGIHASQQFLDPFACQGGHQHRRTGAGTSSCAVRDRFSLFS